MECLNAVVVVVELLHSWLVPFPADGSPAAAPARWGLASSGASARLAMADGEDSADAGATQSAESQVIDYWLKTAYPVEARG